MAEETFNALSGAILLKDGSLSTLNTGDPVPADADPEDLDRLRRLGHIGIAEAPAEPSEEQGDAPTDEMALEEFVSAATVDEVLAAADSPEKAEQLLDIEEARQKPRKGVVEGLQEIIADAEPSEEQGDAGGEA